jgi:DNA invertase Pin-like site-specific DNA recombinase
MGELIGYARCSTVLQDLTAQRQALTALGVPDDRIYLDKGLTGTSRARPGLDQALAAVRTGDTLVVPKLDRLARSVPDARHIGDSLVARGIKLSLGGTIYDPADPLGKMFFNILATFAEFEVDLLRLRTREGMAVARAKGKLKGKQPKLTPRQQTELTRMHTTGEYTIADLMEVFSVGRATVYRTLERTRRRASVPAALLAQTARRYCPLGLRARGTQRPMRDRFSDDLHPRRETESLDTGLDLEEGAWIYLA